mmetsp:Transcript_19689/g.78360  ORF Transcript_19689/g.78360 Transcript_19689/m.78360 type:complete len:309 (+) Transcript_19689:1228-2154(+)
MDHRTSYLLAASSSSDESAGSRRLTYASEPRDECAESNTPVGFSRTQHHVPSVRRRRRHTRRRAAPFWRSVNSLRRPIVNACARSCSDRRPSASGGHASTRTPAGVVLLLPRDSPPVSDDDDVFEPPPPPSCGWGVSDDDESSSADVVDWGLGAPDPPWRSSVSGSSSAAAWSLLGGAAAASDDGRAPWWWSDEERRLEEDEYVHRRLRSRSSKARVVSAEAPQSAHDCARGLFSYAQMKQTHTVSPDSTRLSRSVTNRSSEAAEAWSAVFVAFCRVGPRGALTVWIEFALRHAHPQNSTSAMTTTNT